MIYKQKNQELNLRFNLYFFIKTGIYVKDVVNKIKEKQKEVFYE